MNQLRYDLSKIRSETSPGFCPRSFTDAFPSPRLLGPGFPVNAEASPEVSSGAQLGVAPPADEVVEVPILLPGWQMEALEKEAHDRGLTAAEMVRQLLADFLSYHRPCADDAEARAY